MDIPHPRHERKFAPPGLSVGSALALVCSHPALFREQHPERVVNNIYFDTPDLRHYRNHVSGAADRLKFRIRWYGAFEGEVAKPVLEVKLRHGAVSGKQSHPLSAFRINGSVPASLLASARTDDTLPGLTRLQLADVQPVLGNRYRRRYFRSADGTIRITVDWGIEFFEIQGAGGGLRAAPGPGPMTIIELKYPPSVAARATGIGAHFPFRLCRCSKYVLGIQHVATLTG
jgi:hypothetical protein